MMKRSAGILAAGIVLCLVVCLGSYHWLTAPQRAMMRSEQPELAWLKREFHLTDAEFERIASLHNTYLPRCAEMCARIDATNALIREKVSLAEGVTPETSRLLEEAAMLRAQCQKQMLEHFTTVSRAMSPEQGRRYLAWVQNRLFEMHHDAPSEARHDAHHGH